MDLAGAGGSDVARKTHTFDLTKAGLPVKLLMYGAKDHAAAMKMIHDFMRRRGIPYLDKRGTEDFSL